MAFYARFNYPQNLVYLPVCKWHKGMSLFWSKTNSSSCSTMPLCLKAFTFKYWDWFYLNNLYFIQFSFSMLDSIYFYNQTIEASLYSHFELNKIFTFNIMSYKSWHTIAILILHRVHSFRQSAINCWRKWEKLVCYCSRFGVCFPVRILPVCLFAWEQNGGRTATTLSAAKSHHPSKSSLSGPKSLWITDATSCFSWKQGFVWNLDWFSCYDFNEI